MEQWKHPKIEKCMLSLSRCMEVIQENYHLTCLQFPCALKNRDRTMDIWRKIREDMKFQGTMENRYVFRNKRFMSKAKDCDSWWSKQLLTVRLDKRINPCYFFFDVTTVSHRKPLTSTKIKMVLDAKTNHSKTQQSLCWPIVLPCLRGWTEREIIKLPLKCTRILYR